MAAGPGSGGMTHLGAAVVADATPARAMARSRSAKRASPAQATAGMPTTRHPARVLPG